MGTDADHFILQVDILQGDTFYDMIDSSCEDLVRENLETDTCPLRGMYNSGHTHCHTHTHTPVPAPLLDNFIQPESKEQSVVKGL